MVYMQAYPVTCTKEDATIEASFGRLYQQDARMCQFEISREANNTLLGL